jgi:4-hydroxy-4-methyl-2-oxoglutarate aldolase
MNRHLHHGTVHETIERADPNVVAALGKYGTSAVSDAMAGHGVMRHDIKPISGGMAFAGSAVTVLTRAGDALYVQRVADVCKPGDAVVIDAGGVCDMAVIGERIAHYMKTKRGVVGLVVDGAIRDRAGIIEVGLPAFARGVTPRLHATTGPGAINVPIQCGGVCVNPGDVIIGDDDGVAVVPREDAARVLETVQANAAAELARFERVQSGEPLCVVNGSKEKIDAYNAGKT